MLNRRGFLAAGFLAASLSFLSPASAQDAGAFVTELGQQAVEMLTGEDLTEELREQRFRELLMANFDVPAIGKTVLGRYWRTASDAERTEYLSLFEDFLVNNYAERFAKYSGETFEVKDIRESAPGEIMVQTIVVRPNESEPPIRLDWLLSAAEAGFRVLDIKIEGISMAETHRSEFASVIQNSGGKVAGLIEALTKKLRPPA